MSTLLYVMRNFFGFIFLFFLTACINDKNRSTENNPTIDNLYYDSIENNRIKKEKWFDENLIPKNDLLISFSYSKPTKEEVNNHSEEFKDIRGYENKTSLIETIEYPDSLIVIFYKRTKKACEIKGNILLQADTVKLLFKDICSPFDRGAKRGEFYKFKYIIKSSAEIKNKTFKAEERQLLK